jgi:hypothetical protein
VQVESFAIRLRQRSAMEAADLGVRLCQNSASSVFRCYFVVAIPIMVFALASFEIASWLPAFAVWWLKPWLDRTILFVLARSAFGQPTSIKDLWKAQRQVWWSGLFRSITTRRLSPWRSFTQPVYQLEGLSGDKLRKRVRQIRSGKAGAALLMTGAFNLGELAVSLSLMTLLVLFTTNGVDVSVFEAIFKMIRDDEAQTQFVSSLAYILAVLAIEPFYVASGFAMYINRRVDLEAWDIEQEFRRADFARNAT